MSLLQRLLSPSYRRAVSAEGAGNYLDAARAYALCGQRLKVGEMHLLEAQRLSAVETTDAALRELQAAVHWLDDSQESRALLGRVGRAFVALLREGGARPRLRALSREAAGLALRAGDPVTAAEAYELAGDRAEAAAAYREAGEVERMEALLQGEERRARSQSDERDLFSQYQMQLLLGQRDAALGSLRACLRCAQDPAEAQRLVDELSGRILDRGWVRLRRQQAGGEEPAVTYVGVFPLLIGRGLDCQLALSDPGVSRTHASIGVAPALPGEPPTFALRDLQSRNGTALSGLLITGEIPLRGAGAIGIGDHCAIDYEAEGAQLALRVARGLLRGHVVLASPAPFALPGGATLHFAEGRPFLSGDASLRLNGGRTPGQVQLIAGDVVEQGGLRHEVLG